MKFSFHIITFCLMFVFHAQIYSQFTDITSDLEISHICINDDHLGGGVAIVDVNSDGWMDMVFTGGAEPDRLFINETNGEFTDQSSALSKPLFTDVTSSVVSGDFNNDGCPDLYFSVYDRERPDFILQNNCDGTFGTISLPMSENSMGATLFDFNKDGLLDIYAIGYVRVPNLIRDDEGLIISFEHECSDNTLLLNQGDFNFENATSSYNAAGTGCALAVTVLPLPEQETHGIYIANDFGEFLEPNNFLVLEENSFVDQAQDLGVDKAMFGMGIGVGDYDNDLDLDFYLSNLGENILYKNDYPLFTESQADLGVQNEFTPDGRFATSWGTFFMDVDNDADLDLYVANGFVFAPDFIGTSFIDPNQLYLNENGQFFETDEDFGITLNGPNINRGAAMGDLDNDGDMDIVVSYINFDPSTNPELTYRVYRNDNIETENNFLNVELRAMTTAPDAFGSQVIAYAGDQSWLGYKYSSGTHCSQNASMVHFGFGDIESIDSIKVIWPNYEEDVYQDITINRSILLTEGSNAVEVFGCSDVQNPSFDPLSTLDIRCQDALSTSIDETTFEDISYYKDGNQLTIIKTAENFEQISLYNLSGQLIYKQGLRQNNSPNYTIELPSIVTGIYIMQMTSSSKALSAKLFL